MPHDDGHTHIDAASGDRRVAIAIWANGVLTLVQIVGGIISGSLALIADAIHNFSDMAALVIAFGARKISRRPADGQMTFGYQRIEIVASLINYTTLIVIGIYLVYEGVMRMIDPPEVLGWWVVILGGVALVVDTLTVMLTYSMQKGSVNIRALFLHNLSDALSSVAVIVGGTLILLYDLRWIDPAITIGIAIYILYLAFTEIGGTIRLLMLASPPEIEIEKMIRVVSSVQGVEDIHRVHFWQIDEQRISVDAHIVVARDQWARMEAVKSDIKKMLAEEFGITHSTLEFEHPDHAHQDAAIIGSNQGRPDPV
uniref:cation diffusion facilitator family transporter n=1 Tax=Yoonia sp. TaxID=2212373 RepID=UPI004047B0DD